MRRRTGILWKMEEAATRLKRCVQCIRTHQPNARTQGLTEGRATSVPLLLSIGVCRHHEARHHEARHHEAHHHEARRPPPHLIVTVATFIIATLVIPGVWRLLDTITIVNLIIPGV